MAYKKPQDPLTNNGFGIYPLTTADQVILSDGSRLEKNGVVSVNVATAVNSEKLGGKTWAERLLDIYPIGSIYISVNSTSPASLFGGTWQILNDVFLLAAGSYANAGTFGGEAAHALTVNEIPSHAHGCGVSQSDASGQIAGSNMAITQFSREYGYTSYVGGNQPHNNMPPYMAVYMWKRVS